MSGTLVNFTQARMKRTEPPGPRIELQQFSRHWESDDEDYGNTLLAVIAYLVGLVFCVAVWVAVIVVGLALFGFHMGWRWW